jgi:hypothetical protein
MVSAVDMSLKCPGACLSVFYRICCSLPPVNILVAILVCNYLISGLTVAGFLLNLH